MSISRIEPDRTIAHWGLREELTAETQRDAEDNSAAPSALSASSAVDLQEAGWSRPYKDAHPAPLPYNRRGLRNRRKGFGTKRKASCIRAVARGMRMTSPMRRSRKPQVSTKQIGRAHV